MPTCRRRIFRQDVDGHDVALFFAARADAESGDLALSLGYHAFRTVKSQIGAQLALGICDLMLVAELIDFVENVEILWLVVPERDCSQRKV